MIDKIDDSIYHRMIDSDILVIPFTCYCEKNDRFDWKILLDFEVDILFVRDLYNAWYLRGIKKYSSDVDSTVIFLDGYAKKYKKVVLIGSSMGGYASILFKNLITHNNIEAHAFGPQISLSSNDCLNIWTKNKVNERVIPFISKDDEKYLKIYTIIDDIKGMCIHYSEDSKGDEYHATLIGCEKVKYPGGDHALAASLHKKDKLSPFLKNILKDN